jgi:type VI secretion system protein ImpC
MSAQTSVLADRPHAAGTSAETDLLDRIVEESRLAKSSVEHARARDIISELVSQVMEGAVVVSDNLAATLDARVAELDRRISCQLSAVMHAPEFQKLESSWTGLHYLVRNTATGRNLKIKMLNATKKELVRDFQSALDFDQSTMFKKVYEEEFGTFGGAPFGVLLGDFDITRQPGDMYLSSRCRISPLPPMHPLSLRPRRNCSAWSPTVSWASRAIYPRLSTPSNTPAGRHSASRRMPVMSA